MKKYIFEDMSGNKYERINKTQAEREFLKGVTVWLCPCNLIPVTMAHFEMPIKRKDKEQFVIDEIGMVNFFKDIVSSFEYYNCNNTEVGKYTAFYKKVVDRNDEK